MPKKVFTPTEIYAAKRKGWKPIRRRKITFRPVKILSKDVIKQEEISKSPDWFVLHRRGIGRPQIGGSPLEARAVPHEQVAGTLPERILYKYLVNNLRMHPDIDFYFQSSEQGGRQEIGGMIVDFLFPLQKMVILVQGPQHYSFLDSKIDEQQTAILEDMGYTVYCFDMYDIYDEYKFETIMRRLFHLPGIGGYSGSGVHGAYEGDEANAVLERINNLALDILARIQAFV